MDRISEIWAKEIERRFDELVSNTLFTTNAEPAPQEPLTLDKLKELISNLPPAPSKLRFVKDEFFPQEHYADRVEIIPHHPLQRAAAKFLDKDASTATVMCDAPMTRPDGTCFQYENTVFIPSSFKEKFEGD